MSDAQQFQQSLVARKYSVLEGKYMVGPVLGMGTYGGITKGLVLATGTEVAIKFSRPSDKTIVQEARVYEQLQENRHTPSMLHSQLDPRLGRFLVISLEEKSLHDVLSQHGKLPNPVVAGIMVQLVEGLQFLHSKGVVHRDVTLANVLVSRHPDKARFLLADFGLSTVRKAASYESLVQLHGAAPVFTTPFFVLKGQPHVELDDFYQLTYMLLLLTNSVLLKVKSLEEWKAVKFSLVNRLRETLPAEQACFENFFRDIQSQPRLDHFGMGRSVDTRQILEHLKEIENWHMPIAF